MDIHTDNLNWRFFTASQQRFFMVHRGNSYRVDLRGDTGHFASMSFTWMQHGLSVKLVSVEDQDNAEEAVFLFPGIEPPSGSMETRELQDGNSVYLETPLAYAIVMVDCIKGSGDIELDVIATTR